MFSLGPGHATGEHILCQSTMNGQVQGLPKQKHTYYEPWDSEKKNIHAQNENLYLISISCLTH